MRCLLIVESFGSIGTNDDLGLILIFAAPVLLFIAFIFFVIGMAKKNLRPKMIKIALILFIVAGISALVGLGQCGWY